MKKKSCINCFVVNTVLLCFVLSSLTLKSFSQSKNVSRSFVDKMMNNGKAWKAVEYDRVQVNGKSVPITRGSILFKANLVEVIDQDEKKSVYSYTIKAGVVDPRLETSDGKVYEVRFFDNLPVKMMRLRCIKSSDKFQYLEDITYTR